AGGAHGGRAEGEADPERGCGPPDAAHEPRAVARTQLRRLDPDGHRLRRGRARLARPRPAMTKARAGERGDLAGDPEDRETVAAIRRDLDLEHGVGDPGKVGGRRPRSGGAGKHEHLARVVAEAELRL